MTTQPTALDTYLQRLPIILDKIEALRQLANTHEQAQTLPWKISDAPSDFIERMLEGIVGIEIPIEKLIGKWKVSQNRPEADKHGIVAGLMARDHTQDHEMAALVSALLRPIKP